MTIDETSDFLHRIKSHYQEFSIDQFKIDEWYKELQYYDSEDVNEKLEEHLKSEIYGSQIPKVYILTKYLTQSKNKGKINQYTIICNNCGQAVADQTYDKHYKRCSATSAIIRDLKKYFNLNVKQEELENLSDSRFELAYQKYLNKMLDANISNFRRKIILCCIYPNNEIDIDAVAKAMAGKE